MKFNVNQQDLQQALNYCQGVIEKRSTLQILSTISGSFSFIFSIVFTECIIVVWSLFENSLPISGSDFEVRILVKYIAVCLGLTKYLDLLEDSISFLLILKYLQTTV